MLHVAWSVCVSVCVLGTRVSCAKTAEPTEMPFGGLTDVGTRKHVVDRGLDQMNAFPATGVDKTAMQPFAKLLPTLINTITISINFVIIM